MKKSDLKNLIKEVIEEVKGKYKILYHGGDGNSTESFAELKDAAKYIQDRDAGPDYRFNGGMRHSDYNAEFVFKGFNWGDILTGNFKDDNSKFKYFGEKTFKFEDHGWVISAFRSDREETIADIYKNRDDDLYHVHVTTSDPLDDPEDSGYIIQNKSLEDAKKLIIGLYTKYDLPTVKEVNKFLGYSEEPEPIEKPRDSIDDKDMPFEGKTSKLKNIIKEVMDDLNTPPVNWDKGWEYPLQLRTGEEPFRIGDRWYLFVTDKRLRHGAGDIAVYDFGTDMIEDYTTFQKMIGN